MLPLHHGPFIAGWAIHITRFPKGFKYGCLQDSPHWIVDTTCGVHKMTVTQLEVVIEIESCTLFPLARLLRSGEA